MHNSTEVLYKYWTELKLTYLAGGKYQYTEVSK